MQAGTIDECAVFCRQPRLVFQTFGHRILPAAISARLFAADQTPALPLLSFKPGMAAPANRYPGGPSLSLIRIADPD